jgi:hypothetical protein
VVSQDLLNQRGKGKSLFRVLISDLHASGFHMCKYFWQDCAQLNIYHYKTEEYSDTAVNKFNVIQDSILDWVFDFLPMKGGYFIRNVSPALMDFQWFAIDNCIAILLSLATPNPATAIMDLFEENWQELIGDMPLKVVYPALDGHDWQIVTGCGPKNTRWSYHNGDSWPSKDFSVWVLSVEW